MDGGAPLDATEHGLGPVAAGLVELGPPRTSSNGRSIVQEPVIFRAWDSLANTSRRTIRLPASV